MDKNIRIKINNVDKIKDFLKVVRGFSSDIDIMTDRAIVDAKSILGVYALNLSESVYVRIISEDIQECRKFDAAMEKFK